MRTSTGLIAMALSQARSLRVAPSPQRTDGCCSCHCRDCDGSRLVAPVDSLDRHEGTAAWVQAAGAIIIIGTTAWIASRNSREAQERERIAKQQLWESIAALARNCLEAIDTLLKNYPQSPGSDTWEVFFTLTRRATSTFQWMGWPAQFPCIRSATQTLLPLFCACEASWVTSQGTLMMSALIRGLCRFPRRSCATYEHRHSAQLQVSCGSSRDQRLKRKSAV